MKRALTVARGVALMLALSLAGCGSKGDRAARAVPTISIAAIVLPEWDPARTNGTSALAIHLLVYDTLTRRDDRNELVPGLATTWSTPDGGTTYDFTLRDGVRFSNGDIFDSADAKASLDYYLQPRSTLRDELWSVDKVIALNPRTLRIIQSTPNVALPDILSGRSGTMLSAAMVKAGDFDKPVGTGKFLLSSEVPLVSMALVPNPAHWQPGAARVGRVVIRLIEDPVAAANALRSGDVDMGMIGPGQVHPVLSTGLMNAYEIKSIQLAALSFNPDLLPALKDVRVRNALSLAIDREGIALGIYSSAAEPASQFVRKGARGYSDAAGPIPYDPPRARALLAQAGVAGKLSFTMAAPFKLKSEAEAVQANWAAVGVHANLIFPAGAGVSDAIWRKPSVPVGMTAGHVSPNVTEALHWYLSADSVRNPGKLSDANVTRLIHQAASTEDEAARQKILDALAIYMAAHTQAYVPLTWNYQIVVYAKSLTGMKKWHDFPVLDGVGVKRK